MKICHGPLLVGLDMLPLLHNFAESDVACASQAFGIAPLGARNAATGLPLQQTLRYKQIRT